MNPKSLIALPIAGIALLVLSIAVSQAAPPPTPASCGASYLSERGGVVVSWADVAGETGYRLYRDAIPFTTLGPNVTDFLDLDMKSAGGHQYCVEAFNGDGTSSQCCATTTIPKTQILVEPWNWFNDCFPTSNTTAPSDPAFAREPARIRSGFNTAPLTGTTDRLDTPGDTLLVDMAGLGSPTNVRMDLVFRIQPGPGNYSIVGDVTSPIRQVPGAAPTAVVGDGSFWGQYMANPGQVSQGLHGPGNFWNKNVWNSARIDTAEVNIFPVQSMGNLPGIVPGLYASMYHEQDPKFATLGVLKNICFLIDPSLPPWGNMTCGAAPYPPPWVAAMAPGDGWDGSTATREYTKVLPDNLFTPGTHIEYFLRRSDSTSPLTPIALDPDTEFVTPQLAEGSLDAHRWEQVNVLPDLWKSVAFPGGLGLACMLVVDYDDGNGDERAWISAADSIGADHVSKAGAGVGWLPAAPDSDINEPDLREYTNRGQPGTTWDLFQVRGAAHPQGNAGTLGSRYGFPTFALCTACVSTQGPTLDMLRDYYRVILIASGGRSSGILGPFADRPQNDVGLLENYLSGAGGLPQPRGLFTLGSGFAQSEMAAHPSFVTDFLGATLRAASYRTLSGNTNNGADLSGFGPVCAGNTYGVVNDASSSNDVLDLNLSVPEALGAGFYEPVGGGAPYLASVYKSSVPARPWISLLDGWDLKGLGSQHGASSIGRLGYLWCALRDGFGPICNVTGPPLIPLDVPDQGDRSMPRDFVAVRNNPLLSGVATVEFGLGRARRAELGIFDLAGRRVRLLASMAFDAGPHRLDWDGRDDAGRAVARGLYFVRLRTADGRIVGASKLTILR
jgi:hypothetical protein